MPTISAHDLQYSYNWSVIPRVTGEPDTTLLDADLRSIGKALAQITEKDF